MSYEDKFNEDYYLRGPDTGVSNYTNYRWLPELTLRMADILIEFMGIEASDRVLDYGCARGYIVKALRMRGVAAYGCDISKWAIDNCDPAVKPFVGHPFDMGDQGFEHLFCKDVLEHIPGETLVSLLPHLFKHTARSALIIVPLADKDGGKYLSPNDEKDATHIQRKTLMSWMQLIRSCAPDFVVMGATYIPVLKLSAETYADSTGFIYCKRFSA